MHLKERFAKNLPFSAGEFARQPFGVSSTNMPQSTQTLWFRVKTT